MRWALATTLTATGLLSGCNEVTIGTRNSIPTVTITSHFDDDTVVEGIPFTVRASAGDNDHTITDLRATWYVGNERVEACERIAVADDGNTECEVQMFLDTDPARINVEVRDPRDGVGTSTVTLNVTPQQAGYGAPTTEILEPLEGATSSEGDAVFFIGDVSDAQDPPGSLQLEWTSSLDGVFNTNGADSAGTAQFVASTLSRGQHVITLKATDTDGNFTTDFVTHTVNGAPSVPTVAIDPSNPSSSQDLNATIVTPSVDPDGDAITYTFAWFKDGVEQADATIVAMDCGTYSRVREVPRRGRGTAPPCRSMQHPEGFPWLQK